MADDLGERRQRQGGGLGHWAQETGGGEERVWAVGRPAPILHPAWVRLPLGAVGEAGTGEGARAEPNRGRKEVGRGSARDERGVSPDGAGVGVEIGGWPLVVVVVVHDFGWLVANMSVQCGNISWQRHERRRGVQLFDVQTMTGIK